MKKTYQIVEHRIYRVEAKSEEQAEELYNEWGEKELKEHHHETNLEFVEEV